MNRPFNRDVAVIGGCGHVGLPLALTFADLGLRTVVFDTDQAAVERVRQGNMPFAEEGADELLARVLKRGTLDVCAGPELIADCRFLVLIVGTPVDQHLNPSFKGLFRALDGCAGYLRPRQVLILRSTVYPGMSQHVRQYFVDRGLDIAVAFCPERVAQGQSLREFRQLPQIISAFDPVTLGEVAGLFGRVAPELIEMEPMEAELCKLMTNAWRYIQFATVNQFYMIATENNLDFDRILHGCRHKYPRMAAMPGPGLAAGPCLLKDTMQLAAFSQNTFILGHAAMLINEGLPAHLVRLAKRSVDLRDKTVGILGMAFKAGSDDVRDSLSFKLHKLLKIEAKRVLRHDPYAVNIPDGASLERLLAEAEVLFVATPHPEYRQVTPPSKCTVFDVWSILQETAPEPARREVPA